MIGVYKDVCLYKPLHCVLNWKPGWILRKIYLDALWHNGFVIYSTRQEEGAVLHWAGTSVKSFAPGLRGNMFFFEKYKSKTGVTDTFDHFLIVFTKTPLIYWCLQMLHVASGPPQLFTHGCVRSTWKRKLNGSAATYTRQYVMGYVLVFCTSVTSLRSQSCRFIRWI